MGKSTGTAVRALHLTSAIEGCRATTRTGTRNLGGRTCYAKPKEGAGNRWTHWAEGRCTHTHTCVPVHSEDLGMCEEVKEANVSLHPRESEGRTAKSGARREKGTRPRGASNTMIRTSDPREAPRSRGLTWQLYLCKAALAARRRMNEKPMGSLNWVRGNSFAPVDLPSSPGSKENATPGPFLCKTYKNADAQAQRRKGVQLD